MRQPFAWTIAATLALAAFASLADEPPVSDAGGSSLDQQLLEGLDRELLEGLPGPANLGRTATKTPDEKAPGGASPAGPPAGGAPGMPGEAQNPLAEIAAQMRGVESRITAGDTSAETLGEQKQILAQLAALLEQAQKQGGGQPQPGQGSGRGASSQPGDGGGTFTPGPVQDSTDRIERGTPEASETTDIKDLVSRLWGHLPDKLRGEMQTSLSEQFLPKYERLIEQYYKRLAEERPAGP
jgi:hypothetical protein